MASNGSELSFSRYCPVLVPSPNDDDVDVVKQIFTTKLEKNAMYQFPDSLTFLDKVCRGSTSLTGVEAEPLLWPAVTSLNSSVWNNSHSPFTFTVRRRVIDAQGNEPVLSYFMKPVFRSDPDSTPIIQSGDLFPVPFLWDPRCRVRLLPSREGLGLLNVDLLFLPWRTLGCYHYPIYRSDHQPNINLQALIWSRVLQLSVDKNRPVDKLDTNDFIMSRVINHVSERTELGERHRNQAFSCQDFFLTLMSVCHRRSYELNNSLRFNTSLTHSNSASLQGALQTCLESKKVFESSKDLVQRFEKATWPLGKNTTPTGLDGTIHNEAIVQWLQADSFLSIIITSTKPSAKQSPTKEKEEEQEGKKTKKTVKRKKKSSNKQTTPCKTSTPTVWTNTIQQACQTFIIQRLGVDNPTLFVDVVHLASLIKDDMTEDLPSDRESWQRFIQSFMMFDDPDCLYFKDDDALVQWLVEHRGTFITTFVQPSANFRQSLGLSLNMIKTQIDVYRQTHPRPRPACDPQLMTYVEQLRQTYPGRKVMTRRLRACLWAQTQMGDIISSHVTSVNERIQEFPAVEGIVSLGSWSPHRRAELIEATLESIFYRLQHTVTDETDQKEPMTSLLSLQPRFAVAVVKKEWFPMKMSLDDFKTIWLQRRIIPDWEDNQTHYDMATRAAIVCPSDELYPDMNEQRFVAPTWDKTQLKDVYVDETKQTVTFQIQKWTFQQVMSYNNQIKKSDLTSRLDLINTIQAQTLNHHLSMTSSSVFRKEPRHLLRNMYPDMNVLLPLQADQCQPRLDPPNLKTMDQKEMVLREKLVDSTAPHVCLHEISNHLTLH